VATVVANEYIIAVVAVATVTALVCCQQHGNRALKKLQGTGYRVLARVALLAFVLSTAVTRQSVQVCTVFQLSSSSSICNRL
jgi:hypothetical protein